MVVYAEGVFLNNFVIDAAILSVSARSVRAQKSIKRLLLGACLGGAFACATPLLPFGGFPLLLIKTAVGACIAKCGIKTQGGGRFLLSFATFFGYTFLLGGAVSGLCGMLNLSFYGAESLLFFPAYLLFRFSVWSLRVGKKFHRDKSLYYQVTLYALDGKSVAASAFLDTGNGMERKGQPVLAVSPRVFSALYRVGNSFSFYPVQTAVGVKKVPMLPLLGVEIQASGGRERLQGGYAVLTQTPLPLSGCEVLLSPLALALTNQIKSAV